MPRLSSRPIGASAFAAILLFGVAAVTLIHSEKIVESEITRIEGEPPEFDQGLRVDFGMPAAPKSGQVASRTDPPNGWTPLEKTDFSSPGRKLQIDEPKMFLATAGKSSDGTTVSLTNSTDKIYAYTSSVDDQAAGFEVNVCSGGFVRPNSHCALNIVYRPKVMGNSAARLSLRCVEVGGGETETLTLMLSGFAMANCEAPAEQKRPKAWVAAGCGDNGGGDLAQMSHGGGQLRR